VIVVKTYFYENSCTQCDLAVLMHKILKIQKNVAKIITVENIGKYDTGKYQQIS
jgi:hypothetical protein